MVLLDVPSEGLAPVIVEQMATTCSRMKTEGVAVLLSEQNLHRGGGLGPRLRHRARRDPLRGKHGPNWRPDEPCARPT